MIEISIKLYRSGRWNKAWCAWQTKEYSQEGAEKTIELCKSAQDACKVEIHYHPENKDVVLEKINGVWIEKQEEENAHE